MADYDVVSRKEHLDDFARDYNGSQHVVALGPTGRGKTRLLKEHLKRVIAPEKPVIILHGKIKNRDPEVRGIAKELNVRRVAELPSKTRQRYDRKVRKFNGYLLIPLDKPMDEDEEYNALRTNFRQGIRQNYRTRKRQTITYVDEAHQVQHDLKLKNACENVLMRGAPDNAMWSASQRGRWLSYHTYNAPEHMFIFYDDNRDERKRYSDFGEADPDEIEWITSKLRTERVADGRTISQCLYIRRGGGMYVIDT